MTIGRVPLADLRFPGALTLNSIAEEPPRENQRQVALSNHEFLLINQSSNCSKCVRQILENDILVNLNLPIVN